MVLDQLENPSSSLEQGSAQSRRRQGCSKPSLAPNSLPAVTGPFERFVHTGGRRVGLSAQTEASLWPLPAYSPEGHGSRTPLGFGVLACAANVIVAVITLLSLAVISQVYLLP